MTGLDTAVERAHRELWKRFMAPEGYLLDYQGEIPTPEDCREGRPNAIGWWSPIEDAPMLTGLYLPAVCERAKRSGADVDREKARRLAKGLLKCASVSDVPGFIARGVATDGRSHYPLSSEDQTHPWFHGLHAYLKSGIPTPAERSAIITKMRTVGEALAEVGWKVPCDGVFRGQFRGEFAALGELNFRRTTNYLYLLRLMHEITDDGIWLQRYRQALLERPLNSATTRREICAGGLDPDRVAYGMEQERWDRWAMWIYVGSQASLAELAEWEEDPQIQADFRKGLTACARSVLSAVKAYRQFDNSDTKPFRQSDWRSLFTTWFPQTTQAEAEKVAMSDLAKDGGRKGYEEWYVCQPLAAAAIAALAGDIGDDVRSAIHEALCHYDYSRLKNARFFFAECAYYRLTAET